MHLHFVQKPDICTPKWFWLWKDKMKEAVSSSSTTMIENVEFSSPQRFEMTKTRQKLHKKICEIDLSHFCLQQFDKI